MQHTNNKCTTMIDRDRTKPIINGKPQHLKMNEIISTHYRVSMLLLLAYTSTLCHCLGDAFVLPTTLVCHQNHHLKPTLLTKCNVQGLNIHSVDESQHTQKSNDISGYSIDQQRQILKEQLLEMADAYKKKNDLLDQERLNSMTKIEESSTNETDAEPTYAWKLLTKIMKKIMRKRNPNKGRVNDIVNSRTLGTQTLNIGSNGQQIIALAERLAQLNPTPTPLKGWKGYAGTDPSECLLEGTWKLRFTTAADASFSASPARGVAITSQEIDCHQGTLTNVVDFERGKLLGFRVVVEGTARSGDELELSFRKVVIRRQSRFPRWFGSVVIPIPARLFRAVNRFLVKRGRDDKLSGDNAMKGPYFKLLYIDDEFRMHKTGEGNWFIQTRITN